MVNFLSKIVVKNKATMSSSLDEGHSLLAVIPSWKKAKELELT